MTTACKNCSQWQPDSSCSRFDALPADQVDARRKAATEAVRALKEKK